MLSKFRRVGNCIPSSKFLHITPPSPDRVLRTLKTTSNKFRHGDSIMLRLIIPPFKEPRALECKTTDELTELVQTYKGTLAVFAADGFSRIIPRSKYSEVSPSTIYEIVSPFFIFAMDERQHHQVADKYFEDKSRQAISRYLKEQGFSFRELNRTFEVDGKPIAEWEGVYELENGEFWFLECKHCVSTDVILRQSPRLKKSMNALGKPVSSGRVFVAGEFWKTTDGDDPQMEAHEQGFGILFENGIDLSVVYKREKAKV